MRKLLLSFALAACAIGAEAQTEQLAITISNGWASHFGVSADAPGVTVNFSDQWGEYKLVSVDSTSIRSEYKGFKIVCDEAADVQIKIEAPTKENQYDSQCFPITAGEAVTGNFDEKVLKRGTGSISIQATEKGASVTVSSFSLIKADGTEELITSFVGISWGCSVLDIRTSGSVVFTKQYGQLDIVTKEGANCTFDPTTDGDFSYTYKIEFESPVSIALNAELDDTNNSGFAYNDIPVNAQSVEFVVNKTTAVKGEKKEPTAVGYIYVKAKAESGYPATVHVKSVTRTKSKFTALRPVTTDSEVVATDYFTLSGSKFSTPQKGINIVRRTLSDGTVQTDKVVIK